MSPGKKVVKSQQNVSKDATAIKYMLDTDRQAQQLKRNLGMVKEYKVDDNGNKVPGTGEWKVQDHAPMNEKGIRNVVKTFRGIIDKNQIMSIYSQKEIVRLMREFHMDLVRELAMNWNEYGIEKRSKLDDVVGIVTNNAWSALNRAKGGQTLEKMADSTETVTKSEAEPTRDESSGGLGSLLPGGR